MRFLLPCFLIILLPDFCYAGIENELLLEQYDECTIRITHDATPDSKTGTLIYRAYRIINDVHESCDINKETAVNSLKKSFSQYLNNAELKPVTSIMLGRLIRYPWARDFLKDYPVPKTNHHEFNKTVFNSPIIEPFQKAIEEFNYSITDVSCEKILHDENKMVVDGLCWLVINKNPV